jgi:type VI secretion system VasD/TssJ family lipoprotein
VEIRVFQLKNREAFDQANIESLWGNRYKETLGADLVGEPRPYTVFASSSRTERVDNIPEGVRFLGVMAMFSGTTENQWRVSVDIEKSKYFELALADDRMSLKK